MSKITVIRVDKSKAEKGYPIVELAYKTEDDKTKGMKIFGFGDQKEVAAVAGEAKQGDVLEVEFEKNQRGFWQFKTAKNTGEKQATSNSVSSGSSGSSEVRSVSKGNWETSEERAQRQVLIVRQSSVSAAVALKPKGSVEEVIEVAKQFEAYVFGTKPKTIQTGDVE